MSRGRAVFILSNAAKWKLFLPVIRSLEKEHGVEAVVVAYSEVHGTASDTAKLGELGLRYIHPLPVPIKAAADRITYGVWLKRNAGAMLEKLGASVLIVHVDRTIPENLFIRAARKRGIKSVLIQESLRKDEMTRLPFREAMVRRLYAWGFGLETRLRHYGQEGCDAVVAWGATSGDYFRRVGVPADRIRELGNPGWDALAAGPSLPAEKARLAEHLGLPPSIGFLTVTTSPLDDMGILTKEEYRKVLKLWCGRLGRVAAARKDLAVVFKLHNLEGADFYREAIGDQPIHIIQKWDILPLLAFSAGVLQFSTTAGLEAALLGTPVGVMDAGRSLDNWEFVENGIARQLRTGEDLEAFSAVVADPARRGELGKEVRELAEARYVKNLGQASPRVADFIGSLASR